MTTNLTIDLHGCIPGPTEKLAHFFTPAYPAPFLVIALLSYVPALVALLCSRALTVLLTHQGLLACLIRVT